MSVVFGAVNMILTSAAGSVRPISQANDFASISAKTRAIALSGDTIYTFIDSIVPKIQDRVGATSLALEVYGKNRLEEDERLLATLDLAQPNSPIYPTGQIESCVYFSFRLFDDLLAKRWKLFGFQIFGAPDGEYFQ